MNRNSQQLIGAVVFSLLLLVSPATSHARLIGVVVDDSQSMGGRFLTSSLAFQLLIASIDEQDRLFYVRMSNPGKPIFVPGSFAGRQQVINTIKRDWTARGRNTPIGSLTAALKTLQAESQKDEELKLVVLSDGEFGDAPSDPGAYVERMRKGLRGQTVDAYFVAIAPRGNDKILAAIEAQGVRRELLTQFNGSPEEGKVDLRDTTTFIGQMSDLITLLNGGDIASIDSIRYRGTSIQFAPPFAVKKVRVLAVGEKGRGVPNLKGQDFSLLGSGVVLNGGMREPDTISNGKRLLGSVFQLNPFPALVGGQDHQITFDQAVDNNNTRLIFETSVYVAWELLNAEGEVLFPDSRGLIRVAKDEILTARAKLYEEDGNGSPKEVVISQLPHEPQFTMQSSETRAGAPTGSRVMPVNSDANSAFGKVAFASNGQHKLAVRVRYPGFLTSRGKDISVEVVDERPVRIRVQTEPGVDCPACRPDNVDLVYTASAIHKDALRLKFTAEGRNFTQGEFVLTLERPGLPHGVRLVLPDGAAWSGAVFDSEQRLELVAGKAAEIRLEYDSDFQESLPREVALNVAATKPWAGSHSLRLKISPRQRKAIISPKGHTLDPTGGTPFNLRVTDIHTGEGLYFLIDGVEGDLALENLEVAADSVRVPMDVQLEKGHLIRLVPMPWLGSDCLTKTGKTRFSITYQNSLTRQQAVYTGDLELSPGSFWDRCWKELFYFLTAFLVFAKLICLIRTSRFPSRAKVKATYSFGDPAGTRHLHSRWSWLWPFCRNERRSVFGLNIEAASFGVRLLPSKQSARSSLYYNGTPLAKHFEDNGNRPIPLSWGESVENRSDSFVELQLLEK